jgi:hypothetical protein
MSADEGCGSRKDSCSNYEVGATFICWETLLTLCLTDLHGDSMVKFAKLSLSSQLLMVSLIILESTGNTDLSFVSLSVDVLEEQS